MSGGKADLGLNVILWNPHSFQMNPHSRPFIALNRPQSPSIALCCPPSGSTAAAESGPARRQLVPRPGPVNYYQQPGAIYYQLYGLKKSPPAAPRAADGPVKVQCPLAGSHRRPEN